MIYADHIFSDFQEGKLDSFYAYSYPDLLMYAVSILKGSESVLLAEDCVQNAVEKTYFRRFDFESATQWKMYLLACIRNEAISLLRTGKASRNYVDNLSEMDFEQDYQTEYIREETLSRLMNAIGSLPSALREIFDLSFDEGLRNADIARRLNIAEITVKKRKARMIEILRSLLGNDYAFIAPFL